MKKRLKFIFSFLAPLIVVSCMMNETDNIPDFDEQLEQDIAIIDGYLAANSITAIEDISGIRYVIHFDSIGGDKPAVDSCVTTDYVGKLLSNEQEFDSGTGISFPLSSVIDGWKIGIPLLSEGDTATFYIPSGYAYGYYGYAPEIPSNANLIFDVVLREVGTTYSSSNRSCN